MAVGFSPVIAARHIIVASILAGDIESANVASGIATRPLQTASMVRVFFMREPFREVESVYS